MSFISLPAYGAPTWRYTVSTVLALPALNNVIGDVRVTEDTSSIYVWSGAAWILSGGGGSSGIASINADATSAQVLAVGTSGSDFALVNNGTGTHTFNLPTASASNRGALSSTDWSTFNGKQATVTIGALDAQTENASGLALVSNVLSVQSADATHPGVINNTTQTLSGVKTFSSQIVSSVATGTAPFSVASTTQVANLNAATAGTATSATTATTATNVAGGAGGSIPYQSAAATTAMLANGSAGQVLKSAGGTSAPTWANEVSQFGITIDGGGSVIATGLVGFITIPYACTITANYIMADVSGSCVIDVWRKAFASFPPTISDSITTGGTPPTLSSAQSSSDTTLSNWSMTCAANDVFAFNVNSATTVTRVTLTLKVTKL